MRVIAERETVNRFALVALAFVVALLAVPDASYAQRVSGELSGSVVDAQGGVVPGADVVVTNESSKAVRRSVTNSDGFFAFAALPAAKYTLQVSIQGFKTYEVTGIELRSGDSRSMRQIALQVATVAETVSVTSEVALTPLNSGEKSATLTAEQLENIPIVGTSAAEVLRILPGMVPRAGANNKPNFTGEVYGINGNGDGTSGSSNGQSAVGNYSANGAPQEALDITIDGAPGADPGCNCATSVNPNTEFVQEFKVLQSNFSAEHAKGPVNMTVVSKSGGRDFHGSLFYYFRDYHLNSNEWFGNKVETERTKNKFNYPGFTLSGPLLIPGTGFNKNRDKVFFFLGFEYFGQTLDTGFVKSWVPTNEMRNGDFSQAASLGLSGANVNTVPNGFPGGIIPSNQIDPGGRVILNQFPSPNANANQTGGFNYVDNLLIDQNGWQGLARVDFNLSDNTKMFLRYNMQRETQPFAIGLWWRIGGERTVPYPTQITAPNQSDSVSASLTHVFSPTLTNETVFAVTYINFPNQFVDRSKISRSALGYPYQGIFGESNDQIPSYDAAIWANGAPVYYAPGGFDPILYAKKWQVAVSDNLTKILGTHTAKFGFYWEWVNNNQPGNGDSEGLIGGATWGGNSTGNTLADILLGRAAYYQESSKNPIFNMDYNLVEGYAQDSWKVNPRLTVDAGLRFSYLGPWSDRSGKGMAAFDQSRYNPSAPASDLPGVVWTEKDSSVPLSGADGSWFFVTPRVGAAWDVKGTGETVLRGGVGMYRYKEPQSFYSSLIAFPQGQLGASTGTTTLREIDALGASGSVSFNGNTIAIDDDQQPANYNWSLSLNQKLPWAMNVELGYVGNKGDHLRNSGVSDINAVPFGAMLGDPNGNQNSYRQFPQYGNLNVYRHDLYTNYQSAQVLLSRQRGHFNFTAAYTFSKSLGVRSDVQGNPGLSEYYFDPRQYSYGVLGNDRTHVASLAWSWMLPALKDKGAISLLFGDWQLGGVATYVSGAPLQTTLGNRNFNMSGTLADGTTIGNIQVTGSPDVTPQPKLTCDPTENIPSGYLFNPACFAAPGVGDNGNYVFPYIKGNAYSNLDLSLFKNFSIGSKGQKLQLRIAAYNALNHPTAYADPGTNLTLQFTNGVQSNPNFGKLPDDNKFGRRIVQLAVRYTF
jgi:carboxypeptidase family protein